MEKPAYWASNKIFINGKVQNRLMIVFKTRPCRKALKEEKCSVCGFEAHSLGVRGYNLASQFNFLKSLIKRENVEHIDILSSGSILDSKQINYGQVLRLIREIRKLRCIKSVLIEGRTEYCNVEKIKQIKKILNPVRDSTDKEKAQKEQISNGVNNIELEYGIGLESWSNYVRNVILKKNLKLKDYINCLKKLTKINVGICTYVLIGIPKLSFKKSLKEAESSILKIVNLYKKYHCKGRIALFPVFIASDTLLEDLYNQRKYKLVTLQDILKILLEVKNKIDLKKYPIFVGLDDENISQGRYVVPRNRKEEKILKLINKFNFTQEI